jgi:hypothetical protein
MHGRGEKSLQGFGGKTHLPRRRWEDGSERILKRLAGEMWIGFDWLRIGAGGELL